MMNSNIPKRRPQADAQYTMRPILLNVTFLKKTIFTAEFQFTICSDNNTALELYENEAMKVIVQLHTIQRPRCCYL